MDGVLVARTQRHHAGTLQVSVRVFRGSSGEPLAFLRWKVRSEHALTTVPRDEAAQLSRAMESIYGRPHAPSVAEVAGEHAPARGNSAQATERREPPPAHSVAPAPPVPPSPPAPTTAPPLAERPAETEPKAEPEALAGPAPVAARFTLGGRALSRRLRYVDDLRGELPSYRLPAGPALVVGVDCAVDGALSAQWRLGEAWLLEMGAEYRRYYYAMRPEPGDRFIAGGALDEYLSGTVSVGFELR